jgi:hypothetical protein
MPGLPVSAPVVHGDTPSAGHGVAGIPFRLRIFRSDYGSDATAAAGWAATVVRLFEQTALANVRIDPGGWPLWRQLLPHVLAAASHDDALDPNCLALGDRDVARRVQVPDLVIVCREDHWVPRDGLEGVSPEGWLPDRVSVGALTRAFPPSRAISAVDPGSAAAQGPAVRVGSALRGPRRPRRPVVANVSGMRRGQAQQRLRTDLHDAVARHRHVPRQDPGRGRPRAQDGCPARRACTSQPLGRSNGVPHLPAPLLSTAVTTTAATLAAPQPNRAVNACRVVSTFIGMP